MFDGHVAEEQFAFTIEVRIVNANEQRWWPGDDLWQMVLKTNQLVAKKTFERRAWKSC